VANYELLLEETKQVYFSTPDKLQTNESLTLEAQLMGFGDLEGVQYFWDLGDKQEIRLGKTIQHNFRKRGTYTIKCEAYWDGNQLCSYRIIVVE
jgi:plastocyanin